MPRAIPTARSRFAFLSSLAALVVAAISWLGGLLTQGQSRNARKVTGGVAVLRLGR